ncbi:hypothetical protein QYF50_07090 [Paenibacillus vini]|uniref:hypothetical protein n=1 Tax=Paenibacillus vini TaxID=1476024 RepID=UPI0025B6F9F2|nr:hypothetical protein [Paenibacillus vini]MDN4067657.1 hypothetical protein [Paenibacillus vini]
MPKITVDQQNLSPDIVDFLHTENIFNNIEYLSDALDGKYPRLHFIVDESGTTVGVAKVLFVTGRWILHQLDSDERNDLKFLLSSETGYLFISMINIFPRFQRKGFGGEFINWIKMNSNGKTVILHPADTVEYWEKQGFDYIGKKSWYLYWNESNKF